MPLLFVWPKRLLRFIMRDKMAIPNIASAQAVQTAINAVIPDIKLYFNHQWGKWTVCQVTENVGGLILPGVGEMASNRRPYVLYKVQNEDGSYREPSQWDVQEAVRIGREGRKAIEMGGDAFMDKLEKAEAEKKLRGHEKTREMIRSVAPDLRRALRESKQR